MNVIEHNDAVALDERVAHKNLDESSVGDIFNFGIVAYLGFETNPVANVLA